MPKEKLTPSHFVVDRTAGRRVRKKAKEVREQTEGIYADNRLEDLRREAQGAGILAEAYYLLLKGCVVPDELVEEIRRSQVAQALLSGPGMDLFDESLSTAVYRFSQERSKRPAWHPGRDSQTPRQKLISLGKIDQDEES